MRKISAAITAIGGYLPDYVLTNAELEKMVDTTDEWITTRTGIKTRHLLKEEGAGTSFMGIRAAKQLFEKYDVNPKDIDLLICASTTPDMPVALTGCFMATELGCVNAFSFDLQGACSGFLYGMSVASKYIESGRYKKVLLIGADKMSSIIDYTDRATCIIFGDGAGAMLFEPNYEGLGVQDEILRSDGIGRNFLRIEAGGSILPASYQTVEKKQHLVYQDGKAVFKYAVSNMADTSFELMQKNNLKSEDVAFLVPHQANKRIIEATAQRMGLPMERVMINIQKYGNTTAATLPLAVLDYLPRLKRGDNLIFATFGGGFTWGAMYVKWAI